MTGILSCEVIHCGLFPVTLAVGHVRASIFIYCLNVCQLIVADDKPMFSSESLHN